MPETGSQSGSSEDQKPTLVVPAPHTRTQLKIPTSSTARAIKRAPVKSKRKQAKPRQDGIFKRFTLLVVKYVREKLIWAKKKPAVVSADTGHDKRIAENYVFDEVLGIYVPRAEYERRARFNTNGYKPTKDEISRFPNRPKPEPQATNNSMDLDPSQYPRYKNTSRFPKMRPPRLDDNG